MYKNCFIFPGQGAQKPGMGKSLYDAFDFVRELFNKADKIAGRPISRICFEGPDEELQKTSNSQLALYICSIASYEVLRHVKPEIEADYYAGLSLGEYPALTAAGVLSFEDGVKLVDKRASIMQGACEGTNGGMASIIGLSQEKVEEICSSLNGYMIVANVNCPGQYVVSGDRGLLEAVCAEAKKAGAKLTVILKVAGAFHSRYMEKASELFRSELKSVSINKANLIRVISNVTGVNYTEADDWADIMACQIMKPVLWEQEMRFAISNGIKRFYELGAGKTLSGMLKRIDKKAECYNLETFEQIKDLKFEL